MSEKGIDGQIESFDIKAILENFGTDYNTILTEVTYNIQ